MRKIARRGFLKMMGAAPVAGGALAKEAAAQISGVSVGPSGYFGGQLEAQSGKASLAGMMKPRSSILKWLIENGIPEWKRKQIREQVKAESWRIDPNIASMRSMSLQAMYAEQVRRNVKTAEEQVLKRFKSDSEPWQEFYEKHGHWL